MSQSNLSRGSLEVLDLFAGPGGWDVAAKRLGLDPLGIEWDTAACQTRAAAGLRTRQADVAALDPRDFSADLLIASPPCQAFSAAGKRLGEQDKEHIIACSLELAAGNDTRAAHREKCADDRSLLVVEALRWALALEPEYIAFEQVPPVLELWTLYASLLERVGYRVWVGILEAERYGVPQTRERAILMASRRDPVAPPYPTHQRYIPGEPARHDFTLEGEILPWVSMAEALGWDGAVNIDRSGDRADEETEATEPGPTVTARARRWMHKKEDRPERIAQGAGNRPRGEDQPAATIDTRTDLAKWEGVDVPAPTVTAGGSASGGPEVFGRGGAREVG